MDVSVDMESSLGRAAKFNGAIDNLLVSLKYPFSRAEYERGVRSSGVPLPTDIRRGAGVMNPFPFAYFLFKLLLLFGTDFEPNIASFSESSKACSFFWSYNNEGML